MADREGGSPIALSRREATALLLVAGAELALPGGAVAARRINADEALRAAAEFAMSF